MRDVPMPSDKPVGSADAVDPRPGRLDALGRTAGRSRAPAEYHAGPDAHLSRRSRDGDSWLPAMPGLGRCRGTHGAQDIVERRQPAINNVSPGAGVTSAPTRLPQVTGEAAEVPLQRLTVRATRTGGVRVRRRPSSTGVRDVLSLSVPRLPVRSESLPGLRALPAPRTPRSATTATPLHAARLPTR